MKKVKRILFCLLLICFLFLGIYIVIREFLRYENPLLAIENDVSLLIPILLNLLAVISFLFNVDKLQRTLSIKSTTYKVFRICDLIFSISLALVLSVIIYFFIDGYYQLELKRSIYFFRLSITVLLLLFSLLLFFDNLQFHKAQKKSLNKINIDEIGV
ncbi:hypothetical protein FDT66_06910 [Polaribacter aestuariivivens]|uniref:Uncharacterized protein n=1 Tax=Polaribacter aestuariivivens TaxID=2304626 RepID=A0A5S3N557_9FLAO|nr:hypothetical protein [Polaribacter aestuariivivens]TMM30488.1 hypothetical protein FDT66_06910 [Polaribacter aestuariivivens]